VGNTNNNSSSYDSSWVSDNEELWDNKFEEWEGRNWTDWLTNHLVFPFEIERKEDDYFNPLSENINTDKPFSLGHVMKVNF